MRKIRSMIGMPVICDGKRIGRMIQADISEDLKRLSGIWMDAGLKGARYISSENLEILGDVSILTDSAGQRRHMNAPGIFHRAVSIDGQRLGAITGAEINDLSFSVESLELSGGFWDDFHHGRIFIRNFTVNRASGEVIIDLSRKEWEAFNHETWHDQGTDHRYAHRQFCRNAVRRDELADGEKVESESPTDRKDDQP